MSIGNPGNTPGSEPPEPDSGSPQDAGSSQGTAGAQPQGTANYGSNLASSGNVSGTPPAHTETDGSDLGDLSKDAGHTPSGRSELEQLKLQDLGDGHESLPMQALSATLKDLSTTQQGEIHEMKDYHAADNPRMRSRRRLLLGLAALIALGLLVGFGARFFGPQLTKQNPGPPDAGLSPAQNNPGPPEAAGAVCSLSFVQPSSAAGIPGSGPANFEWTDVPGAAAYSLEVDPPAGGGPPWVLPMKGTSKTIFMENFPAGGEYRVSVSALSADNALLCHTELQFSKTAADQEAKNKGEGGSGTGSGAPCISIAACP